MALQNPMMKKKPGSAIFSAEFRKPLSQPRNVCFNVSFGPIFDCRHMKVFYEISRRLPGGAWSVVYRSEPMKLHKTADANKFDPCVTDEVDLTGGHELKGLQLALYQTRWLNKGKPEFLGAITFCLEGLLFQTPGYILKFGSGQIGDLTSVSDRQASLFASESDKRTCTFDLRLQNF
mmetsp:Transcript_3448/g.10454  ORF Transcript_3448/g.10454 Transcript_3448/m.10454 type:complete len:177 (+) Transcript_3448:515-1045(+)